MMLLVADFLFLTLSPRGSHGKRDKQNQAAKTKFEKKLKREEKEKIIEGATFNGASLF